MTSAARMVLDTNVVLDWLLFDDPHGRELGEFIVSGPCEWIATPAMQQEYFEVLGRPTLARWRPDPAAHRRLWDAHCRLGTAPAALHAASSSVRCADPDDQMFVDLAMREGAALLLSRDRALLDLKATLGRHGVTVTTPRAWVAARAAACRLR